MSKKLLSHLEVRLKEKRRHLLKEINLKLSKSNKTRVCWATDIFDIASNFAEHNIKMTMVQSEAREINQIDNALKKIEEGKYGVCEHCDSKINKQRLIAIPFVTLCVKCKEAEERDENSVVNRMDSSECENLEEVEELKAIYQERYNE